MAAARASTARSGQPIADETQNAVVFSMVSPDGEQGFPGTVHLSATYRLTDDNVLDIRMRGTTDAPTILNAVHHTYWNLAGQGSGDVRDQMLKLNSDFYTPIDAELITTGEVLAVAETVFDFREAKPIGTDIDALQDVGTGNLVGGGYDHNWCLNGWAMDCSLAPASSTRPQAAASNCTPTSRACSSIPAAISTKR